jgi:hypothetical protein
MKILSNVKSRNGYKTEFSTEKKSEKGFSLFQVSRYKAISHQLWVIKSKDLNIMFSHNVFESFYPLSRMPRLDGNFDQQYNIFKEERFKEMFNYLESLQINTIYNTLNRAYIYDKSMSHDNL